MRRKTRPRVVWFPHTNANTLRFDDNTFSNVIELELTTSGATVGNTVTGFAPVIIDENADVQAGPTTLSDIENSGYRLRRIVGKCFVAKQQIADDGGALLLAAAAFIILKVNPVGQPNAGEPAGGSFNVENLNLFRIENDDAPYIWRREWMLQNSLATGNTTSADYPHTNSEYGSAADGPHIDQKTARIVGQDERLFFVCSVMNLNLGAAQTDNNTFFHVTTRVLGSMRTSLGNRRNASR